MGGRARRAGAYIKGTAKQLSVFYEYAVNIAAGQGRRSAQPALFPAPLIQVWMDRLWEGGDGGACKPASSVSSEAAFVRTTKGFQQVTNALIYWLILLHLWTLRICRNAPVQLAAGIRLRLRVRFPPALCLSISFYLSARLILFFFFLTSC